MSYATGNPKNDHNGPVDEAAGSANSYLFLAGLNALAALPLAVAPHTVSINTYNALSVFLVCSNWPLDMCLCAKIWCCSVAQCPFSTLYQIIIHVSPCQHLLLINVRQVVLGVMNQWLHVQMSLGCSPNLAGTESISTCCAESVHN